MLEADKAVPESDYTCVKKLWSFMKERLML